MKPARVVPMGWFGCVLMNRNDSQVRFSWVLLLFSLSRFHAKWNNIELLAAWRWIHCIELQYVYMFWFEQFFFCSALAKETAVRYANGLSKWTGSLACTKKLKLWIIFFIGDGHIVFFLLAVAGKQGRESLQKEIACDQIKSTAEELGVFTYTRFRRAYRLCVL